MVVVTSLILASSSVVRIALTRLVTLVRSVSLCRCATIFVEIVHVGASQLVFLGCCGGALRQHLLYFLRKNNSKSLQNLFVLPLLSLVVFFLISVWIVLDVERGLVLGVRLVVV